jgi:hypothetical protein
VRYKVEDYARWKAVFDEHGPMRKDYGFRRGYLLRNAHDASELVILFEVEDLDRARQFTRSEAVREAMRRAGVTGRPDVYFLEELEQVPV